MALINRLQPISWQPSADQRRLIGHIILQRPETDSGDLGLKVIGGRHSTSGRLGAFITQVKPGSVAEVVGQLRPGKPFTRSKNNTCWMFRRRSPRMERRMLAKFNTRWCLSNHKYVQKQPQNRVNCLSIRSHTANCRRWLFEYASLVASTTISCGLFRLWRFKLVFLPNF